MVPERERDKLIKKPPHLGRVAASKQSLETSEVL